MSKYLLLYTGGAGMLETEEARNAEFARWGQWYGGLGAAVVDGGNPFGPAVKRVTADGRVERWRCGRDGDRLHDYQRGLARPGGRKGQGLSRPARRRHGHGV